MRSTLKALMAWGVIVGITSCSSHLPTDYYLIDTAPAVDRAAEHFPLTLSIANVYSPSRYQEQMVYCPGEYEVGFYEHSQWVELPAEMVRRTLINALGASGLFLKVNSLGTTVDSDLVLRGEIGHFDQIITGEDCFADFELTLDLLQSDDRKSVWSYRARARVKQEGSGQFAAAMSEAVRRAITEAILNMGTSGGLKELAREKVKES